MRTLERFTLLAFACLLAATAVAEAQQRRQYIGYVYPAGGKQGTTFEVRCGGQRLNDIYGAEVAGEGVTVKLVNYYWRMSPQDRRLLYEQLKIFRNTEKEAAKAAKAKPKKDKNGKVIKSPAPKPGLSAEELEMKDNIEHRLSLYERRAASSALQELVFLEVTIAPDAEPGAREIRMITARGLSNPMPFYVGQLPETSREPMKTAAFQVLGKEYAALRHRPAEEEEVKITLPCTMNGQIASGEKNRYRFTAKKGQRLVIDTLARQLVPYVADAVPGWFQPVLSLADAEGNEIAYGDDFRFKPDPVIQFEAPADGEYVLTITDALFRGREDWVYRMTISEQPFVSSIFPLGRPADQAPAVEADGWHLDKARLKLPPKDAAPGVYMIHAERNGKISNAVPFAVDALPEIVEAEPNNDPAKAQKMKLPVIINGRIDQPDDWDVYTVQGKAGQTIVAEVNARRLDSPLDSIVKVTDAQGKVLAFNDDFEDPGTGLNTHHADSYVMFKLPADGVYHVHIGDTARHGGSAYAYRLRLSEPRPDFALRVVPSSVSMRPKGTGTAVVYAIYKDGFNAPITLSLNNPPKGFSAKPVTLGAGKEKVGFKVYTTRKPGEGPIDLVIQGEAKVDGQSIIHEAVAADDMMQAFLWRHLVPAQRFQAMVEDPGYKGKQRPAPSQQIMAAAPKPDPKKTQKFSKRQAASQIRRLDRLYQDWYMTEELYAAKIAECQTAEE
ncbi:hypothetical protein HED60_06475 [Planctomycetales bacterium ZRK34]|nr:hypothetical protein HED60_06475 [Planctomycetales bacterium ZRK34]